MDIVSLILIIIDGIFAGINIIAIPLFKDDTREVIFCVLRATMLIMCIIGLFILAKIN